MINDRANNIRAIKEKAQKSRKKKDDRINPLTAKRAKQYRVYYKEKKKFLAEHPKCEACAFIKTVDKTIKCLVVPEVHHSAGKVELMLMDASKFKAACRNAHNWAEENPKEAKELGISQSRLF